MESFKSPLGPVGRSMLESAKRNLKARFGAINPETKIETTLPNPDTELAFFGLLERQTDSQKLFEDKFGVTFTQNFEQRNKTVAANTVISEEKLDLIREYNALDIARACQLKAIAPV